MKKILKINWREIKKINWKKTIIILLVIYVLIWSYIYLGIQYSEHRQKYLSRAFDYCFKLSDDSKEVCLDAFKRNGIKGLFIFKPLLIKLDK